MMNLKFLKLLAISSTLIPTFFFGHPLVNADETIPTVTRNNGGYQLNTPDWSQITWVNLPRVKQKGYIKVPLNLVKKIGYDPSRSWSEGQSLDEIIMLGDVEEAFKLGSLSLKNISAIVSINPQQTLKDFGLMEWQTPASLLKAIPQLYNLDVNQIKPIKDLFALSNISTNGSLGQIIKSNPQIANLSLSKLDLTKYGINSIPGLAETQISKLKDWRRTLINQVPGLNQIPFDLMPQPIPNVDVIGVASLVLGQAEQGDINATTNYYISGKVNRTNVTIPVACKGSDTDNPGKTGAECAYLELGDLAGENGALYGKRWVSGSSQEVKGGFGILAAVNNGLEPTGRLVYGSAFKVVLTGVEESTGTADFGLYFRFCTHIPFAGKTCTPYFIGPVPWIPVKENDLVIVGN